MLSCRRGGLWGALGISLDERHAAFAIAWPTSTAEQRRRAAPPCKGMVRKNARCYWATERAARGSQWSQRVRVKFTRQAGRLPGYAFFGPRAVHGWHLVVPSFVVAASLLFILPNHALSSRTGNLHAHRELVKFRGRGEGYGGLPGRADYPRWGKRIEPVAQLCQ